MPTRPAIAEGRTDGEAIDMCTHFDPPGYWERHVWKVIREAGEPHRSKGSDLDADLGPPRWEPQSAAEIAELAAAAGAA